MKKWMLRLAVLLTAALMLACHVQAADVRYVDAEKIYAYKKKDTNSKKLKTLYGGQKLLIEQDSGYWVSILVGTSNGQTLGYVRSQHLSYTMPQRYCNHHWGSWKTVKSATCTAAGKKTRTCSICGKTQSQTLNKLGHSYGGWTVIKRPTCTQAGQRVRYCTRCGHENYGTLNKLGHSYGVWNVTKEATCTREGSRYRVCLVCGYKQTQTIKKKAHSFGPWEVVREPTCSKKGAKRHTCTVCGFTQGFTINMTPHDYKWEVLVQTTDHSSGERRKVCKVCGYALDPVSFDPEGTLRRGDRSDSVAQVQRALIEMGYLNEGGDDGIFGGGTEKALMQFQSEHNLQPDGVAWPQSIKLLQHDFGPWTTVKPVTRTDNGERSRICKDCGFEQHETVYSEPAIERGSRSDAVRALQQITKTIGYDAGKYDGIYGQLLETAYQNYAAAHGLEYRPGVIYPAVIDGMMNDWIAAIPNAEWMGEGNSKTPVNPALTVKAVRGEDTDDLITYEWSLTNLGSKSAIFAAVLLSYGENPDFRSGNIVVVLDGEEIRADCANSVSGTFRVGRTWGEGKLNFCALAVSEDDDTKWLSNSVTPD